MNGTSAEREIESNVTQFPVCVVDAYEQWKQAKKDEARAKKHKEALRTFLDKSIPYSGNDEEGRPIGSLDGINKIERSKGSTKWKEAYAQTFLECVPEDKKPLANQFVDIYTSTSTYPDFKREED